MSSSNSQVPANRHNQRQNIPSARVTPQQQYPQQQQQQQPQRYNNHVIENNSSTIMNYAQGPPSTPPRTPRRVHQGKGPDRNATVESAAESGQENNTIPPRSSNRRPKPKTQSITPAAQRVEQYRGTPPVRMQSDGSAKPTPTAIAAYAGPTFHASPAPSALPLPSFYSKSVPDSPSTLAAKANNDQDSSSAASGDSPPFAAAGLANSNLLDTLFSSGKDGNERARSAQSDGGPFRPPTDSPANGMVTPNQRPPMRSNHGSSSSLFKMEMDGYQGQPYGAALGVTPYHERINAARSTPASISSSPNTTNVGPHGSGSQSEAFKSLLFNNGAPSGTPAGQPLAPFQNAPAPTPVPYQNSPQHSYQNGRPSGLFNGYQAPNGYQNQNNYQHCYQNGPQMQSPVTSNRATLYNSPQQPRFPHQGQGSGYRGSPRNSGLRQEAFRSPNSAQRATLPRPAAGLVNGMFAPPQISLNKKENSVSPPKANANVAQNPAPRAVTQPGNNYNQNKPDLGGMEHQLRDMLKISPTTSAIATGGVPNTTF